MLRTDDPTPIILKLSSNKKSIIAVKGNKMWMQAVSQLEILITYGISIDLRQFRDAPDEKIKYVCTDGIVLKKYRSRVHTWIDGRRYSCSINRLRKLLDGEIGELIMVEYVGRYRKTRKLKGLVR